MKLYFFLFVYIFSVTFSFGTHIKAGEITSERLSGSGWNYRFTLTFYLDSNSVKANPSLTEPDAILNFGDGETLKVDRLSQVSIGNATLKNTYIFDHIYAAPGTFKAWYIQRNRNNGILNIANSVDAAFYIESEITINSFLGLNHSPILQVPAIAHGAIGQIFEHNPGAYDPDGDSLSYKMVIPQQAQGQIVNGYLEPSDAIFGGSSSGGGAVTSSVNPITGIFSWDSPAKVGDYTIAMRIEEWRNGKLIGYVVRDMMIEVKPGVAGLIRSDIKTTINLYPIPSNEVLNIESSKDGINKIEIKNMFGEILLTQDGNGKSINLESLSDGIYFLCIYLNDLTVYYKKIEVLH